MYNQAQPQANARQQEAVASAATAHYMPGEQEFFAQLEKRHQRGRVGRFFNIFSVAVAGFALIALFANVVNQAFGTIGVVNTIEPATLTEGRPLDALDKTELAAILLEHAGRRLRVLIRDTISQAPKEVFTKSSVADIVGDPAVDPAIANELLKAISRERQAVLLATYADNATLRRLVLDEVVEQQVIASFPLYETIFNFEEIRAQIEGPILNAYKERERRDDATVTVLRFHSWLDSDFLTTPMSSTPALAGVRTALIGSAGLMLIVILVALPIGLGSAIYLEEYAHDGFVNRLIETNVRNLAGVPSIIYGMLGLAIFVRALAPVTSGLIFGVQIDAPNGRTLLSAGLTLALLILPIIIINAQEAIRAVPYTIREASYGLGATRWQTVWRSVLPAALPGIMTGTILSVSRAVGETAPLIVVGAATFLLSDPTSPFSQFTAMPIQIYQWTARPQGQFADIAAAAIIVLLALMLSLNAVAIVLRNKYSIRY